MDTLANRKTAQLHNPFHSSVLRINRPAGLRAVSLLTHFALGLVTGFVQIFDECAPFGAAMAARSGGGLGGFLCMLGAAVGYLLSGGFAWSLRYMAALILIFTTAFILRETTVQRRTWFMPLVTAGFLTLTGLLNEFGHLQELDVLVHLATEAVVSGAATYLFIMALTASRFEHEREEERRLAGGVLLLCCTLMALSRFSLWNTVCVGRVLAVLSVEVAAFGGGGSAGAMVGVICGLAVDLSGRSGALFTVCYGFAGLAAGSLRRPGRFFLAFIFLSANAMVVFRSWQSDPNVPALYEAFAGSVLFLLLPAKVMTVAVSAVKKPNIGNGESGMRRYTACRTRELAEAFRELYETVRRSAESSSNDSDIATVYDRAAEAICVACPKKSMCWQMNYQDTIRLLNDATETMKTKGQLEHADLPKRFRENCPASESFTVSVNMELRAMMYRRRLKARLEENRWAAYGQYRYLAGVLEAVSEDLRNAAGSDAMAEKRLLRYLNGKDIDADVAVFRDQSHRLRAVIDSARLSVLYHTDGYMDEISELLGVRMCRPSAANRDDGRLVLLEAEPLAVSVGVAAMKKEGETVSGDRGTYFKTEQGVLCVLLSDGMGSGEKAAKESISVVHILERFLRSGVEPGTAMKILNSVMLLKNGDEWGYATVDLMCIDLFSGQTGFYKYGAAPSYIRVGHNVRRVRGITMAAGILAGDGETPDVVRMRLRPGGMALIASDGVVADNDDAWLRKIFAEYEGSDTRELARSVIRAAGKLYGYSDDMTVLAVRVEERK